MVRPYVRRIGAGLLAAVLCLALAGCWDRRELEDQHFLLAIGFDKRPGGGFVVSAMLAVPAAIAGGGGPGGDSSGSGGHGSPIGGGLVVTVENRSVLGAIAQLEVVSDRRINVSHLKGIFIGEELARDGIAPVLNALARWAEARRLIYVIITCGSAQGILRHLQPRIEQNPGKYIEEMLASSAVSGLLPRSQVHNLHTDMEVPTRQPLAALASLNETVLASDGMLEPGTEPLPADMNVLPGETRRAGGLPEDYAGAAMLQGDRLVGMLTGAETRIALMLRGDFRRGLMSFVDPREPDKSVAIDVRRGRATLRTVRWVDGEPEVTIRVRLEGELAEVEGPHDWSDPERSQELGAILSVYLQQQAEDVVRKAQEAGTDILGAGEVLRSHFPTWNDFIGYDWMSKFPTARIVPDVKLTIRRTGLILQPVRPTRPGSPPESIDGWHSEPQPRRPVGGE